MSPPPAGRRRMFARANVAGARAGAWADLPAGPELDDLEAAGLVTPFDYRGEPAPEMIRQHCCGEV